MSLLFINIAKAKIILTLPTFQPVH